ncbi:MAG TPA: glycerol-3-phosphate acyltransferase [Ilumatobacter sp.]|nr:glycerol-3-phosphate acyltransferase [Ilumatobacter sp.]
MRRVVRTFCVGAIGYAIGCVPVADLIARRHGVDDLRAVGDGNPGYWNAREQIGTRASAPIFVGDVAKGAAAAALARFADGPWWIGQLGGGAAMLGHAFPAPAGGRGGRSVLTFVGAAAVFAPRPAAISTVALGAAWTVTRRFDVAARVGIAAFPFVQLATQGARRTAATGALMTFIGFRFAQLHAATSAQG